jgi:hypothetical protein
LKHSIRRHRGHRASRLGGARRDGEDAARAARCRGRAAKRTTFTARRGPCAHRKAGIATIACAGWTSIAGRATPRKSARWLTRWETEVSAA